MGYHWPKKPEGSGIVAIVCFIIAISNFENGKKISDFAIVNWALFIVGGIVSAASFMMIRDDEEMYERLVCLKIFYKLNDRFAKKDEDIAARFQHDGFITEFQYRGKDE